MQKKLLVLLSVLFVILTTFAYSALSTSLAITSEVKLRPLADIRVNRISLNSTSGSTVQYESDYSKNSISSGFILPDSSSSISYTVHIDNTGDIDYTIYNISTICNNSGINVSLGTYNLGDIIPAKSSIDIIVTYTTTTPSDTPIDIKNIFDYRKVFYINYNTGTTQTIPQQIKYENVDLTLTTVIPTKPNYAFTNWNTKSDGTGVNYNSGATYTLNESKTLYALWELKEYTIAYTMNGGTKGASAPESSYYDNDVIINNPTKTITITPDVNGSVATVGSATSATQIFAGWSSNTIGNNAKSGTSANPTTVWDGTNTTDTYFKNLKDSGSVTMVANWTPVAVPLPTLTVPTGYTCKYYTDASGGEELGDGGVDWTPSATSNSSITAYVRCTAHTNIPYKVRHYIHDLGTNTYTLNSTDNLTGTTDTTLTLTNLKKTISGFTYVDGYLTGDTTKPTSGAVTTTTILGDGTRVINLYYRRNYLYVRYHINGGSLGTSGMGYGVSDSLVTYTGNGTNTNFFRGVYGGKVGGTNATTYVTGTDGLHNYNNPDAINIVRSGYAAKSAAEWNTNSGGTGTSYGQDDSTLDANGFAGADLTTGDKTVTLYVNWQKSTYTLSYSLNKGTVSTANPTSYTVTSSAITLNNPTKVLTFVGNYNSTSGANCASGTSGLTKGSNTTQVQTFAGWSGTGLSGNQTTVTIPTGSTGNRSYTAHWTAVAGTLPTISRTGYTCGWNASNTGTTRTWGSGGTYATSSITEGMDTTVNLYCVCNPNTYTVTLNGNGATSTNHSTSATATYNSTTLSAITRPTKTVTLTYDLGSTGATKSGGDTSKSYTFNGWYTATSDGTKVASNAATPALQASASGYTNASSQWTRTSGATLYAQWAPVTANLPTLTKTGYTCKWLTDGGEAASGGTWTFTAANSRTFTASCTINKIYIKMNANGGSLASAHGDSYTVTNNVIKNDGNDIIHTINYGGSLGDAGLLNYNNSSALNLVKTGYTATGWNTNSSGTGTTFNQDDSYAGSRFCDASVNSCTVTLYVKWEDLTPPTLRVDVYKRASSDDTASNNNISGSSLGNQTGGDASSNTPTLSCTGLTNNVSGWLNKTNYPYGVRFKFTYSDNGSGIKNVVWRYNDTGIANSAASNYKTFTGENTSTGDSPRWVSLSGEGARWAKFTVEDNEGNKTAVYVNPYLDRTAPNAPTVTGYIKADSTDISAIPSPSLGTVASNTWTKNYLYVVASGSTDSVSGNVKYYLTTTGQATNVENSQQSGRNINTSGTATATYWACDKAGNCSGNTTYTSKQDRTAPTATITKNSSGSCNSSGVDTTIKCVDNTGGSGVTAYYWGTSSPSAASGITTTTSLSSVTGSGLSKNDLKSTHYLGCKDSLGNWSKTSVTVSSSTCYNSWGSWGWQSGVSAIINNASCPYSTGTSSDNKTQYGAYGCGSTAATNNTFCSSRCTNLTSNYICCVKRTRTSYTGYGFG